MTTNNNEYFRRRKEIFFEEGKPISKKRHKAIKQYQKEGTISGEMFEKTKKEREILKKLKKKVNNSKFEKYVVNPYFGIKPNPSNISNNNGTNNSKTHGRKEN